LLAMRLSYSLNYSSILCLRRRDQHIGGDGVLEYCVPITPPLQYSIISLSDLHIPTEDPFTRQRPIIDVLRHAEEQLMAPHELRRRFIGDQAHRLRKQFFALRRIEGLALSRQELIQLRVRITDARRGTGFEVLGQGRA